MADLLAANVTVIDAWKTGGTGTKRNTVKRVKWTSTTAGGDTNKLLASALGFNKILNCSHVLLASSTVKVYPAAPSADGSRINVSAPTQVTDANRADVADLATSTDFAYCTVEGIV